MNAAAATNQLSYKQLQAALKSYKEQGLTGIKLNSKQEVLEQEYARLTAKDEQPVFTTKVIPAMNSKYAPSWLCKPMTVYVIDGVDYLSHELEAQLQGQVCQLPAAVNERKLQANQPPRLQQPARKDRVSKARQPQPIINSAKELPKVAVTFKAQEEYSPYFIDSTKAARYSKTLGDVERQAARNLEDAISATKQGLRNVINFGKGFHARQVERARKVAA